MENVKSSLKRITVAVTQSRNTKIAEMYVMQKKNANTFILEVKPNINR